MELSVAVEIMATVIATFVLFAGIVALIRGGPLHGTILIACGLLIAFLAT